MNGTLGASASEARGHISTVLDMLRLLEFFRFLGRLAGCTSEIGNLGKGFISSPSIAAR